jgi:hypothetical protein
MSQAGLDESVRDETVDYYYYLKMIGSKQRVSAFQCALQSVIRQGDVVVEVGAGLGTYSLFAAQSGARRVYAIEKERVIYLARELAVRNGLAERITFVKGDSTGVTLPEKADVLVLENFSSLFVRRGVEEIVRDALDRHLKKDGSIIPRGVSIFVAPMEDRQLWKSCLSLEDDSYRLYGLDLSVLREMMLESPHVGRIDPQSLLSEPQNLKAIDFKQTETYLFDEVISVRINRSGTMYGLAGWFDLKLTESLVLSNAPENPESTWEQVFFPIARPMPVAAGETMTLRLSCARSSRTRDVWWTWQASAASGLADHRSFQGIAFPL